MELHPGARKYERAEERSGYVNGYKLKTVATHAGNLLLQIPQVCNAALPYLPKALSGDRDTNVH